MKLARILFCSVYDVVRKLPGHRDIPEKDGI